ncbi:MAG: rhodanese-like domain-containing protein [Chitinophagales bacterium]|nr:rhodanese-like domain-containing protein [Chitinophagales bacterium]
MIRNLFFALAATFAVFSCQNNSEPKKMSGLATAIMDSTLIRVWPKEIDSLKRLDPNIPIVDVRTELEYRTSHIFRSINCSVKSADFDRKIVQLNRQSPVIVYDESSTVSLQAAERMKALGFVRVYELAGGIYSWARDGKALVSGDSGIDSNLILK